MRHVLVTIATVVFASVCLRRLQPLSRACDVTRHVTRACHVTQDDVWFASVYMFKILNANRFILYFHLFVFTRDSM